MQGIAGRNALTVTCLMRQSLVTWQGRAWKACGTRMFSTREEFRKPFGSLIRENKSSGKTVSAATRSLCRKSMKIVTAGLVTAVCLTGRQERFWSDECAMMNDERKVEERKSISILCPPFHRSSFPDKSFVLGVLSPVKKIIQM
jgi:hypothetical protein